MNKLLKVIESLTNNEVIKSIINSVNDNQEKCKDWLINKLHVYLTEIEKPKICVAAGWYGSLANKLKTYSKSKVLTFDMDPQTKVIGEKIYNDILFEVDKIETFKKYKKYNVFVCTSCEHLTKDTFDNMLSELNDGTLVALQSNDYFGIDGHINCHKNLKEFIDSVKFKQVLYYGELTLKKYTRFMIIGIK